MKINPSAAGDIGYPTVLGVCLQTECMFNRRAKCRLRSIEINNDGTCVNCHKGSLPYHYNMTGKPKGRGWEEDEPDV